MTLSNGGTGLNDMLTMLQDMIGEYNKTLTDIETEEARVLEIMMTVAANTALVDTLGGDITEPNSIASLQMATDTQT